MYQNLTFENLINELEIMSTQRNDYVVPSGQMRMENGLIVVDSPTIHKPVYKPTEVFHGQLRDKTNIPADYYRRMQQFNVSLLDTSVSSWLKFYEKSNPKKNGLLFRALESNGGDIARALLSDRFQIIDNWDILEAATDAFKKAGIDIEVRECSMTEKRMYIHIVAPSVEIQAKEALRNYLRDNQRQNNVGYGIVAGMIIANSEVGFGKYLLKPRAHIIRCNNGAIANDDAFAKVHLGGQLDAGQVQWSKDTMLKNKHLIMAQTRDAIKHFLSKDYLKGMVQKIEYASKQELDNPLEAMENVVREISKKVGGITEDKKRSILNTFTKQSDTKHVSGIFQALTFEAQTMNADDRYDLEQVAFEMLPKLKSFDKPLAKN